jgi:hypothetical protein
MATVRVDRMAAEMNRLPGVCLCCGNPAQSYIRHRMKFRPMWLFLIPHGNRYFGNDYVDVGVPLCSAHRWRLKWPLFAVALCALILLPIAIGSVVMTATQQARPDLLVAPGFIAVPIGVVFVFLVTAFTPRMVDYSDSTITLTCVSPGFASQAGGRGGTMGHGGTQPQAAYRQSSADTKVMLFAIGGGGIALVLLMGMFYFALGMLRERRFGRMRTPRHIASAPQTPYVAPEPVYRSAPVWKPPTTSSRSTTSTRSTTSSKKLAPGSADTPIQTLFGDTTTTSPPSETAADAKPVSRNTEDSAEDSAKRDRPEPTTLASASTSSNMESAGSSTGNSNTTETPSESTTVVDPFKPAGKRGKTAQSDRFGDSMSSSSAPSSSFPASGSAGSGFGEKKQKETAFSQSWPVHSFPRFGKPTRVPDGSAPIGKKPLEAGTEVWVLNHLMWRPAKVIVDDGSPAITVELFTWNRTELVERQYVLLPQAPNKTAKKKGGKASEASKGEAPVDPFETAAKQADMRVWTDSSGTYRIEARLVDFVDGKVRIERKDGKVLTLPLDRLSEADQEYVKSAKG